MHKGHNHARLDPIPTGVHGKVCIDASGWSTAPPLLLLSSQPQSVLQGSTHFGLQEWRAVGATGQQEGNRGPLCPQAWWARSCLQDSSLSLPSPWDSVPIPTAAWEQCQCPVLHTPAAAALHGCTVGASSARALHPAAAALHLPTAWEPAAWSVEGPSPRATHTASRRANPVHVSRDSHTFVGALPEQPANAKRLSWMYSHRDKEQLLIAAPALAAFHSTIPPSPTHISFVPPFLIPTFLCCPPTHPLRYPTACPSILF